MARLTSGSGNPGSRADQTELRPAFPISLGLWIKASAPGNFKYALGKLLLAGEHVSYGFGTSAGGDLRFFIGWGTSSGNVTGSTSITAANVFDGAWHHVLGVYNGTIMEIYFDGVSQGTQSETRAIAYAALPLYLGSFDGTQLWIPGSYAEAALWNVALTVDEALSLTKVRPSLVRPSALVGHWKLDGQSSTVEPESRNGMDFTIAAGTTVADHPPIISPEGVQMGVPTSSGSSLTGAGDRTESITIAGTAALTAAGSGDRTETVTFAGVAALATNAAGDRSETLTIAGAGALTLPVTGNRAETLTIAGAGSLTLPAIGTRTIAATIAGAAALGLPGTGDRSESLTIAGSGSLSMLAASDRTIALTIAGTATITAAGLNGAGDRPETLTIAGTGAIASVAVGARPVFVSILGSAIVATNGQGVRSLSLAIVGTASLSGAPGSYDSTTELGMKRIQTTEFIAWNPTTVTLIPRQGVKTGTGIAWADLTPRAPQVVRLIDQSSTKGPNGGAIPTGDGVQRKVEYQMLMEWDAEVGQHDYWYDADGIRWEVHEVMPWNGYETRAEVIRYGEDGRDLPV